MSWLSWSIHWRTIIHHRSSIVRSIDFLSLILLRKDLFRWILVEKLVEPNFEIHFKVDEEQPLLMEQYFFMEWMMMITMKTKIMKMINEQMFFKLIQMFHWHIFFNNYLVIQCEEPIHQILCKFSSFSSNETSPSHQSFFHWSVPQGNQRTMPMGLEDFLAQVRSIPRKICFPLNSLDLLVFSSNGNKWKWRSSTCNRNTN